eukprot:333797_1
MATAFKRWRQINISHRLSEFHTNWKLSSCSVLFTTSFCISSIALNNTITAQHTAYQSNVSKRSNIINKVNVPISLKHRIEISVFIAITIDGYIADKNGSVEFLDQFNDNNIDCGFTDFFESIDLMIIGRKTYEQVLSFDCDWPYKGKRVIVLSSTLNKNNSMHDKIKNECIEFFNGDPKTLVEQLLKDHNIHKIYIDGGYTIQQFFKQSLVDTMTLSIIPIVLGDGIPLFSNTYELFELVASKCFVNGIVQNKYQHKKMNA